jgi:hypothetical protein
MAEEDFLIRINYQIEGIDQSIRTSRQALFTLNAMRLSIRDIQQVLAGPTIANVLFTAIQLTRTLTQARRLTRALVAEQGAALTSSALFSLFGPQGGQIARPGIGARITAFGSQVGALAAANPVAAGIIITAGVGASILGASKVEENRQRKRVRERSREAAKAQGLEF